VHGRSKIVVCVPVTTEGALGPRWGRAKKVAVATVSQDGIDDWQEFDVSWDSLHDAGTEGSHHARVARFLREHNVEAVAAHHMGPGMEHMLGKMVSPCGSARRVARKRSRPECSTASTHRSTFSREPRYAKPDSPVEAFTPESGVELPCPPDSVPLVLLPSLSRNSFGRLALDA
jgi:predicted Fe-Mo cluster-binding NifX family protein